MADVGFHAAWPGTGPGVLTRGYFDWFAGCWDKLDDSFGRPESGCVRSESAIVTDRFSRESKSSRCDCFTLKTGWANRGFKCFFNCDFGSIFIMNLLKVKVLFDSWRGLEFFMIKVLHFKFNLSNFKFNQWKVVLKSLLINYIFINYYEK